MDLKNQQLRAILMAILLLGVYGIDHTLFLATIFAISCSELTLLGLELGVPMLFEHASKYPAFQAFLQQWRQKELKAMSGLDASQMETYPIQQAQEINDEH
jgi:hypothetical protein